MDIGVSEQHRNGLTNSQTTSSGDQSASKGEQGGQSSLQDLPCRILVEARGLEWSIYNRSPAYDAILAGIPTPNDINPVPSSLNISQENGSLDIPPKSAPFVFSAEEKSSSLPTPKGELDEKSGHSIDARDTSSVKTTARDYTRRFSTDKAQLPAFLSVLPIGFECDRGAILMGNEHTKCILVAKFDRVDGEVGARSTQSEDLYRQTFDFSLIHPVVQLKPNKEYKEPRIEAVAKSKLANEEATLEQRSKWSIFEYRRVKRQALHALHRLIPYFHRSVQSVIPDSKWFRDPKPPGSAASTGGQNRWLGLSRYLDDDDDGYIEQERWKAIEYGAFETILDSPSVGVSFFWDVPGTVSKAEDDAIDRFRSDINRSKPPDWGVDLRLGGGNINYGPWADRQRSDLQNFFFPTLYENASAARILELGQTRVATVFKLRVEIEKATTVRVPTREESKDWRWKGKAMAEDDFTTKKTRRHSTKSRKGEKSKLKPEIRPAGWLDITMSEDTCISYTMDLVASSLGYHNKLDLDLRAPEMSSSVNHGLLWRSDSQTISCDLSVPLEWNKQREWAFDVHSRKLEVFLLRDHIFLLTDLINDWTAGSPGDFYTFVPFIYSIRLQLPDFKIYLNANDSNIINNPSDINDNTFIVIWGHELTAGICIPFKDYRSSTNRITFDVDAFRGGFQLRTPSWNTQHAFLDDLDVATLKDLRVNGSYDYYTSTSPNLTDTCFLNIHGVAPTIHLYGFLVRYFLKLKDNYFGDDLHFQTLEEYQIRVSNCNIATATPDEAAPNGKLSNDLDVILAVSADKSCLILPANLYSANERVKFDISSIVLDLRFTNYYMDLAVSFSPLTVFSTADSSAQMFVDGIIVSGHRLFGLPPTEPTYVCNWDFKVGQVSGDCSTEFLRCLASALRCFGFSFSDAENALPSQNPVVIHDVTFLRATLEPIRVWIHVDLAAFLFSTDTININYNDWADSRFSDRLLLTVPNIIIACVNERTASRHRSGRQPDIITHAYMKTALDVRMVAAKSRFGIDRQLQQDHIHLHDSRTYRAAWLLHKHENDTQERLLERRVKLRPASMPFPLMPEPITISQSFDPSPLTTRFRSSGSSISSRLRRKQSSFLSLASSTQKARVSVVKSAHSNHSSHDPVVGGEAVDTLSHAAPIRLGFVRPSSISPCSRKSSFQSVSPMTQRARVGLPPSNVTLTSPYEAPYFPLHKINPDTKNVPEFPDQEHIDLDILGEGSEASGPLQDIDESTAKTTIGLRLTTGLQGFCTPEALEYVNQFITELQPKSAGALLDDLQMTVMSDVLSQNEATSAAKTTQIRFQLPNASVRLISKVTPEVMTQRAMEYQCYEVNVSRLTFTSRLASHSADEPKTGAGHDSLFHAEIERLAISARSGIEEHLRDHAKIKVDLSHAIMWVAANPSLVGELQFQGLEVESSNRQVEFLVSLLKCTEILYEKSLHSFKQTASQYNQRLQQLVLSLSAVDSGLPDPVCLTSASNVLRIADRHPRLSDSWKMISRLRCSQQALSHSPEQNNNLSYLLADAHAPDDARNQAIASFEQWRPWDLTHVGGSLLILKAYGPSTSDLTETSPSFPPYVRLTVKATVFRVVIGPGPEQNELTVEKLIIGLKSELSNVAKSHSQAQLDSEPSRNSAMEVFCVSFAVSLNWDMCQLVEDIFHQFKDAPALPNKTVKDSSRSAKDPLGYHDLQLVMAIESGSFSFNTINLKLASLTRSFKTSLVFSKMNGYDLLLDCSLIADNVYFDVSNHSRILLFSQLQYPRIHASICIGDAKLGNSNAWKFAASCNESAFNIQEDVVGLLGIIDHVIGDEMAHLSQITKSLRHNNTHLQPQLDRDHQAGTNNINVILFLDTFQISVALLPSLMYVLKGKVARSSLRPGANQPLDLVMDFDLKEHSQGLVNQVHGDSQDICVLPLPPINGQLSLSKTQGRQSVHAYVTVEQVTLDAILLRGLFSTPMQSEISSLQSSIARDIELAATHYRSVFNPENNLERSESSLSKDSILYNVQIIVAGLDVKAHTSKEVDRFAQVHLDLGCICMRTTNVDTQTQKKLEFEEASVRLREIKLLLERSTAFENHPCGDVTFAILFRGTSRSNEAGKLVRSYEVSINELEVNIYTETASMVVDVLGYLQQKMRTVDLSEEIRNLRARRRMKARPKAPSSKRRLDGLDQDDALSTDLFTSMYSLEMNDIQVSWNIGDLLPISPGHKSEDLVLSIARIDLATKKSNAARLMIQEFQLQMVPTSQSKRIRSFNSALLPEVVFNVAYLSTKKDRRLAFQAIGKSLDLRLTSQFILPASDLQRSIGLASQELRKVIANWNDSMPGGVGEAKTILGNKKLSSLLMDAEFGGAVVYMHGRRVSDPQISSLNTPRGGRLPQHGRYGQFTHEDASSSTTLRAPGIAWKIQYTDLSTEDPSLNAEIKVDASTNILHPTIVPLILEISASVKEIVGEPDQAQPPPEPKSSPHKFIDEEKLRAADPSAILGSCRLNLGLRICRQEFSLTCQPIAKVAATAQFEDIYLTINTVQAADQSRFFAVFASFTRLQASVQHVYSRESTGSFEVDSIVMSLMNSKHVSSAKGISAILKISPMKVQVNAKQLQDFLLFREIWIPPEMRHSSPPPASSAPPDSQTFVVQRYQQVAAAGAFPWNATISITELNVHLDLGQSLGKSTFSISNFWVSSKKTSDWEQSLGLGFDKVGVDSDGRMSGFVELQNFRVRTSIRWPERQEAHNQTPLIQASLAFDHLRIKTAFDYQAFLVADLSSLDFLMYNIRKYRQAGSDRLVALGNSDKIQIFCTTTSAAQGLAVYQAVLRLIQEKQSAYQNSLKDIEKFLRRKSIINPLEARAVIREVLAKADPPIAKAPIQLHTDVVVNFRTINVGAFPSTFFDNQIFKLETLDASARFAVALEQGKVHSDLGLTIGQLRIALSGVTKPNIPKPLGEISIDEVVKSATSSRGGTILKVPRVTATMQTWQTPESNGIDYIFKSLFEGKVEVGWNYNRISFIRGMWANHVRTLAQRLGKPLPQSALQITGGLQPDTEGGHRKPSSAEQEKITAVVHMPQSRYQYVALEPPIIETPQLRDMGEATPPLEWIGLHRERLPNVTHQIVIVTLLEVAKEVEDAYFRILGSS